ncbi:hypothetical protein [Neisseria animalis]|uniref:Uncharacterized protein n=1 Tax=Neisseria animalis TaxID=492 RepID=A0A5P3MS06_NEIAN|nr:hypothetical protein [Neisseria animalis]QEY24240.1 hypothetical protein D0T90_06860 [Neisseria animalis]ROW32355.1 hypothetical protein CGZ60_05835 [Neisseria animalis]VEE06593.1 Uncharacterised protein [Neisseria animalis]
MKKLILSVMLSVASLSYAAPASMTKYYNNPKLAPKIQQCRGDIYCNAFAALAKQWKNIPNNYRYHGFNIKKEAAEGNGYGLWKGGFVSDTVKGSRLIDAGEPVFYDGGSKNKANEAIFARGIAVINYIENSK